MIFHILRWVHGTFRGTKDLETFEDTKDLETFEDNFGPFM